MVEQANARAQLRENLVLGAVYTGFFLLVFTISAYLTFPYDRLRDMIMASAANTAAGTGQTLVIGDLSPLGLSGVRLRDVEFARSGTAAAAPIVVRLSELSLRVSLWSLLFGDRKASIDATVGKGNIEGSFEQTSSGQKIDADFEAVDVAEVGLGGLVGLPLKGKATGHVDLALPAEMSKATGSVKLDVRGLHVGDGKAKVKVPALGGNGLTLDEIDAGKLDLGLQVQDGIATLTRLSTDGRDLKVSGKGTVRLVEPIKRSRLDLKVDLTFSNAYKNRSDRSKAMFEILGMREEWKRATTPEGTLRLHVTGTLQAIRGGPLR